MNQYRLTKYNPRLRNEAGKYPDLSEWTGIDAVGEKFKGKILTLKEYLKIENDYIEVIRKILEENKVNSMIISGVEFYPKEKKKKYGFQNDDKVDLPLICEISRLILRDEMWCKFSRGQIYIHFGYDMYVYFSSEKKVYSDKLKFKQFGNVYVERFVSPYLKT